MYSLCASSEGIYKEKGSKFLAFAQSIKNSEDALSIFKQFKKNYHDARHVCYAFRCGDKGEIYKTNDDGEPSGTAGLPILKTIEAHELTNILVVVVRYFGGILLGSGNLARAYKEATNDALNQAQKVEIVPTESLRISCDYAEGELLKSRIRQANGTIISVVSGEFLLIECLVPSLCAQSLIENLQKSSKRGLSINTESPPK